MNVVAAQRMPDEAARTAELVPWMQQLATRGDTEAAFPESELAALQQAGVLAIPLPNEAPCQADARADLLAETLAQLGRGNLSIGRLVEAHINARHLIARFGTPPQRAQAIADVQTGDLFALWATDPPENGLRIARHGDHLRLEGSKMFCSGAGFATRALLTARNEAGDLLMLMVSLNGGERVCPLKAPLQGMRAAVTGAVDFSGCNLARAPAARSLSSADWDFSASRAATTIVAPQSARPSAIPSPIPPLPPVTMATLPVRLKSFTDHLPFPMNAHCPSSGTVGQMLQFNQFPVHACLARRPENHRLDGWYRKRWRREGGRSEER
jgi:Acyl-CoA dehydrogenase, N-terminal domain